MEKVLCAYDPKEVVRPDMDEQEVWMDLDHRLPVMEKLLIIPLIDHPHNDIENGQPHFHYHVDDRYFVAQPHLTRHIVDKDASIRINMHDPRYDYIMVDLVKYDRTVRSRTMVELISKSKFKVDCVHKGKCPHRGYDLSNEVADKYGIVTCPLHGLKFDMKNGGRIINRP